MNAPVSPSAFARERFTVAQIMRLVELGLISEDADFELIDGEITPMAPKGPLHEDVRETLTDWLRGFPRSIRFIAETTLWLSDDTFVEPDFVLYPAAVSIKALKPTDVLLAIEVADSSLLYDLTVKAPRYAAAGIQEYWVLNAAQRTVRVFRGPSASGWAEVFDVATGEKVAPLCAPGLELGV
jgi:Uma2 family endonuclease